MGKIFGYNRVSTKEQNLDRGRQNIEDFCSKNNLKLEKIYEDKQTGTNFYRPRYIVLKEDVVREGDTIIVPEYDRLGRAAETSKELSYFKEHGVRVIFLDIPTTQIDISSMSDDMASMVMSFMNDLLIQFYDLMARTEYERHRKRQLEGIEAKRRSGNWNFGRPRRMSVKDFDKQYIRVINKELSSVALMRELSLPHTTYYRYVRDYKVRHNLIVSSKEEVCSKK